jgi:hypothetical protein
MQVGVYTRERKRAHRINMVKGHLPCFPLAAAQSLGSQAIENKQCKKINK